MKKTRIPAARSRWGALLTSTCLVLAFQIASHFQQVCAIQAQPSSADQHSSLATDHGSAPMMSMGSESSAALESSAAVGDDLIAAESSQSPDSAAEHKAFTAAVARQEAAQQIAASVAPTFAVAQQAAVPQPAQQQPAQQRVAFGGMHPQQMAALPRIHHQPGKPLNPFIAAALAGNYGPAQQQIAAAQLHAQQSQHHPQIMQHPAHHMLHQAQHPQMHPHQQMGHHQQHPQPAHHPQQVQQAMPQPQPQQAIHAAPSSVEMQASQESSLRSNVVPAPSQFNSMDSNSIDMTEGSSSGHVNLAQASSAQHPVIAPVSSADTAVSSQSSWPLQPPTDIPKIVNLEVKCEKNLMKVSIEFDKVFNGVIFSKGHYHNQQQCVHVGQNSGKTQAYFDISINSCGTQGNTQNGLYGMGGNSGSGTFFENTIVVQYDPNVQEVFDHARKLRCTWHDQYEKAVTFRPFPVDMLDIVRADFAGDNVGCWMQIQVGKGPWASEVAGIVKIGQTMTMVLAIKDEENKFDMLVRNCFAHDGKRGPIELVDKSGCITRPKLMSTFTKIKNFGSSATVLSYAHFQAFKFPDSMEVHFQCTIQICRHQCPSQCSSNPNAALGGSNNVDVSESTISGTFNIGNQGGSSQASAGSDSIHLRKYGQSNSREKREVRWTSASSTNGSQHNNGGGFAVKPMMQTVGVNRVIQVVSTGDLAFAIKPEQVVTDGTGDDQSATTPLTRVEPLAGNQICMSSYNFVIALALLVLVLVCSSLLAVSLYLRQKSLARRSKKLFASPSSSASSTCSSYQTQPQHHVPSNSSYSGHQQVFGYAS